MYTTCIPYQLMIEPPKYEILCECTYKSMIKPVQHNTHDIYITKNHPLGCFYHFNIIYHMALQVIISVVEYDFYIISKHFLQIS